MPCGNQWGRRVNEEKENTTNYLKPALWYWMLGFLVFMLFQTISGMFSSSPLAYSDFKHLLYAGKVNEVSLSDTTVSGTLKNGGLDSLLPKDKFEALKCTPEKGCPFTAVRVA